MVAAEKHPRGGGWGRAGQGGAAADVLGDDVPLGIGVVEDGTGSFKKLSLYSSGFYNCPQMDHFTSDIFKGGFRQKLESYDG